MFSHTKCLIGSLPVSAISCRVIIEYGGSWSLKNISLTEFGDFSGKSIIILVCLKHHINLYISPEKD